MGWSASERASILLAMARVKKRGRQRANGEGAISDRKDGRKDVELTVYGLFGNKRLRTTKKNRTEARGLDRADEA